MHLSAGGEGFALPPVDGRWRVLLLDDLQNMQDENDWNALCELIRSGADRRFVLLSPWRAAGLSDRLPVQRNGKILPCAAQSNTIKPPGSINEPGGFSVENGASSYALFRLQSAGGRSCTAATSRTVRPI